MEAYNIFDTCDKKKIIMIQHNTTFFLPADKVEVAAQWLAKHYISELKQCCEHESIVLGHMLTALEDEHIGLTVSSRFNSESEAEKWDYTIGASLRQKMSLYLNMPQILHFNSMIKILNI